MIGILVVAIACLFGGLSVIVGAAISDIYHYQPSRLAHWAYNYKY